MTVYSTRFLPSGSSILLESCLFYGFSLSEAGGGLYLNSALVVLTVINSLFDNCRSSENGGGIYCSSSAFYSNRNCFYACGGRYGSSIAAFCPNVTVYLSTSTRNSRNDVTLFSNSIYLSGSFPECSHINCSYNRHEWNTGIGLISWLLATCKYYQSMSNTGRSAFHFIYANSPSNNEFGNFFNNSVSIGSATFDTSSFVLKKFSFSKNSLIIGGINGGTISLIDCICDSNYDSNWPISQTNDSQFGISNPQSHLFEQLNTYKCIFPRKETLAPQKMSFSNIVFISIVIL